MTIPSPSPRRSPLRRIFRVRSWRKAEPMAEFIQSRIKSTPGQRLAVVVLRMVWHSHADAHGLDRGKLVDLISAVRRAYPETRMVKARSGKDVHLGPHLTGIFLT